MPSEPLSIGARIAAARVSFAARVGTEGPRNKLSQQRLYEMCRAEESKQSATPILFPRCHERVADRKIRAYEKGETRPSDRHLRILERVLRLPEGEFDAAKPSAGTALQAPLQRYTRDLGTLELISRCDILTDETLRVMERLDRALENRADEPKVRVVCVAAPAGYGKSFTIAQWWHAHESKRSSGAALALDCGKMPSDQIIREIANYFCGRESETLNDTLIEAIRAANFPLIILDGLSTESPRGASLPTTSDFETLRPLSPNNSRWCWRM